MDTPESSDQQHRARYANAIHEAAKQGDKAFLSWFNVSDSVEQSLTKGYWDLTSHILTPRVASLIQQPERKRALEIGYGGGRILNAACAYFGEAVGIDVHREEELVASFLRTQNRTNFRLLPTDGRSIPVPDASVDFVYSFIVLQHLPTIGAFTSYLDETCRVLGPGGVAQLYFGSWRKLSFGARLKYFIQGYREVTDAPVNFTSLVIRVGKAVQLCRRARLEVLDTGPSWKFVSGVSRRGGQDYVTLRKKP